MFLTGATQRGYPVLAACSSCHMFCSCHLVFLSVLALEMRLADHVLASGQGSSDQMYTFFKLSSGADSVAIQLALRGKTITGLTKRALKVNIAGPAPPRYDPATKHGSRPKHPSVSMPQAHGYPFPPEPPRQMFISTTVGTEHHPVGKYVVQPPVPTPTSSVTARPKPSMAPRFMAKPSASVSGCSSCCESCSEGGFGGFDESVGRAWPATSHRVAPSARGHAGRCLRW